ncbi:hypothetical protein ASA_0608 [Aeromonas salmonicida subsp. salmonicida A449]|uniref:Uncharacterized protein n=1 Tax=Aeromonas salmonicida (strain A449) TaxID=382245 RepID=A4SIQ2_AERS4|nr:hypothetical protein ASA_0608 [Aeromonas salmonicida subsp. salmonicida A449]
MQHHNYPPCHSRCESGWESYRSLSPRRLSRILNTASAISVQPSARSRHIHDVCRLNRPCRWYQTWLESAPCVASSFLVVDTGTPALLQGGSLYFSLWKEVISS